MTDMIDPPPMIHSAALSEHEPPPSLDDAAIYLKHTVEGVSLRAIARDLGCHPSTILRRVRRFEERRDDPLVDTALSARAAKIQENPIGDQRFKQMLRRMAEPGAEMIMSDDLDKVIIVRGDLRTATYPKPLAEDLALRGWIVQHRSGQKLQRYVLIKPGRDALRAMLRSDGSVCSEPLAGPRDLTEREVIDPDDGTRQRRRFNAAESPLQVLARRRDHRGRPYLSEDLVAAGEQLREDFELAQMGPRVTQNWDRFLTAGIGVSRQISQTGGGSEAAKHRLDAALKDLGSGLGDVALRVCCFLEGLEMAEKRLAWPARSGKLVLKLALERLAMFYRGHASMRSSLIG